MRAIPDASVLAAWRKSSYTNNGEGACVEVSDSYHAGVPVPAWSSFVAAVKDDLARSRG
jgi:hypothetical protein